ncbi:hypothetical protein [Arthrobacter sp. A2-55]|uniref:hypothetical protein n=1 Tax=Arthrobacter sp. A2-55 TaxID=2897337 RepID=UPI0021CD33B9|nr:hypothetical protein [Arthrobacter sp. A2-55]
MNIAQLKSLEDSLGGETSMSRAFVSNYVDMWTGRFQRLSMAIVAEDLDDAIEAALSLSTSSHMVGAEQLEKSSAEVIASLRNGSLQQASLALTSLRQCGDLTVTQLAEEYLKGA